MCSSSVASKLNSSCSLAQIESSWHNSKEFLYHKRAICINNAMFVYDNCLLSGFSSVRLCSQGNGETRSMKKNRIISGSQRKRSQRAIVK